MIRRKFNGKGSADIVCSKYHCSRLTLRKNSPVLVGSQAGGVLKGFGEVALIEKPAADRDSGQRLIGVYELVRSHFDTKAANIFAHCAALKPAESLGKINRMQAQGIRDGRKGEI